MHYRASWSSCSSTQIKWYGLLFTTDWEMSSAEAPPTFDLFQRCKWCWNKTEIKQSRLKQTWNKFCFISVIFQFYFTCKSRFSRNTWRKSSIITNTKSTKSFPMNLRWTASGMGLETTFWSRSRSHSNWSWSRPRSHDVMVSGLIHVGLVVSKWSFAFLIN